MNRKVLLSSALFALAAASVQAHAAEFVPGPYVLGGIGQASYDMDFSGQVNDAVIGNQHTVTSATRDSHNDTGLQLGVGYQFLPWIGVELSYLNLGEQKTNYTLAPFLGNPYSRVGTYKLDGLNLSAVGSFPINDKFSVFGKVGVFHSRLKYSETTSGTYASPGVGNSFSADTESQNKASFGLGAEFHATEKLSVRAGWDRFSNIGEKFSMTASGNGEFNHVDFYSVNVLYHF